MRLLALVALLAALALAGCGESSEGPSPGGDARGGGALQADGERTPAETLAELGGGNVSKFTRHLRSLDFKCREEERRIAGLVYGTREGMLRRGTYERLTELIVQLDRTVPPGVGTQSCEERFSAYASKRG